MGWILYPIDEEDKDDKGEKACVKDKTKDS